jgi:cation diffusion facilitator family transporter
MAEERCLRCGRRVPTLTFISNVSLTLFKITVGTLGGSNALVADGFHSFTDVIGTGIILISCRISSRPADDSHPYGHGKVEYMSAAFIYIVLLFIAVLLFAGGLLVIYHWELHPPNIITLLGGMVSIVCNIIMYRLGQCAGQRNNSPALLANSFENRADALSSVAVVIGIFLALVVHPICDPLAAMAVGVIIFVNCLTELKKALEGLMDKSLPADAIERIRQIVLIQPGIHTIKFIKSRPIGNSYWLDLGVAVAAEMSVPQAETLASELRNELMRRSKHFHTVEVYVSPEGDPSP